MEIDITDFFENAEPFEFSASRAERGENAGPETWQNALHEACRAPLLTTEDQLDALRDYMRDFGAWDKEEIDNWTSDECNALFIQLISGDIREIEGLCMGDNGEVDWQEYERLAECGTISGNIFKTDYGRIYYSLSR